MFWTIHYAKTISVFVLTRICKQSGALIRPNKSQKYLATISKLIVQCTKNVLYKIGPGLPIAIGKLGFTFI